MTDFEIWLANQRVQMLIALVWAIPLAVAWLLRRKIMNFVVTRAQEAVKKGNK